MAATPEELQARLDAIQLSIDMGHTRVEYTDPSGAVKKVEYRTVADLYRIKADIERRLGIKGPKSTILGTYDKGL